MMKQGSFACVAVLLYAAPALAGAWTGTAAQAQFTVIHKFHEVTGVSKKVEVAALIDAQGLKIMARAPVQSFDSGNANRDAHVLEVVNAPSFPLVVVRAVAPGFTLPTTPGKIQLRLDGEVELHGVKATCPIDIELTTVDATHVSATFGFVDTLTAHKIERPMLLFVLVDDAFKVSGTVQLGPKP